MPPLKRAYGPRIWTEYVVLCRQWIRDLSGKKVWRTVELTAADEEQALQFYHDLTSKNTYVPTGTAIVMEKKSSLERPKIIVREITERAYEMKKQT
jgi:hypothetical protein